MSKRQTATLEAPKIALPARKAKRGEKLLVRMDKAQFIKLGLDAEEAEKQAATFEQELVDAMELRKTIAELQRSVDLVEANARERVKEIFLQHYEQSGERPASMEVVTETGKATFLFVVSDKYAPLDEKTALALDTLYKDKQLVHREENYGFNNKVLLKYLPQIESAIKRIRKIPKEDKEQLMTRTVKYTINKGVVNRLGEFDTPLNKMFTLIRPDYCIKDLQPVPVSQ